MIGSVNTNVTNGSGLITDVKEDLSTVARRVKYARGLKSWSQEQLAKEAGVAQSTIGNIEAGLRQSKGSQPQIAEALGVNLRWLRDGEGDMLAGAPEAVAEEGSETDWAMFDAFKAMSNDDREELLRIALDRAERHRRVTAEVLSRMAGKTVQAKEFEPTHPVPGQAGMRYIRSRPVAKKTAPAAKRPKDAA